MLGHYLYVSYQPNYFYKVQNENVNIVHSSRADTAFTAPYIYIYPGPETVSAVDEEKGEKGKWYKTVLVDLEAWIDSSENLSDMNTKVNNMLSDLEKALLVDTSRNNLAIDTRLVSNEVFIESLTSPKCAVVVTIEIDYQTLFNDPADQDF